MARQHSISILTVPSLPPDSCARLDPCWAHHQTLRVQPEMQRWRKGREDGRLSFRRRLIEFIQCLGLCAHNARTRAFAFDALIFHMHHALVSSSSKSLYYCFIVP